jgi:hypothetical protein
MCSYRGAWTFDRGDTNGRTAPLIKIAARPTATNFTLMLGISASPRRSLPTRRRLSTGPATKASAPESRYYPTAVFWSSSTGKPVARMWPS